MCSEAGPIVGPFEGREEHCYQSWSLANYTPQDRSSSEPCKHSKVLLRTKGETLAGKGGWEPQPLKLPPATPERQLRDPLSWHQEIQPTAACLEQGMADSFSPPVLPL